MSKNKDMVVYNEIIESFKDCETVIVYTNGKCKTYCADSKEYKRILAIWSDMTSSARQMPAYGVSLNNETINAINKGVWVEFSYSHVCECAGMNFEKLLTEVQEDYYGFNLIRYNSRCGYDGRCYYVDLNGNNMVKLYDYLRGL